MSGSVLVTGAAGLLGAAVCRSLGRRGVPFTAVWHAAEPAAEPRLRADLTNPAALEGVRGVRAIVHTAAALPTSFEDSAGVAAANRAMDDNVLAQARAWDVPVVYLSGTALYAAPATDEPLPESAPLAPAGPYLEEKARTEERGREQARRTGAPFTALRVSAPYGPGQRARTVLRLWLERARAGDPLEYYGSGSREQDFTWADDVGEAVALALDGPGGVFNVATGEAITMRALAETIASAAGRPPATVRAAGRPDPQEGRRARYDVGAAARVLGWRAATPVQAGVARLLEEDA